MGTTLHKDLTGIDLHVAKLHADTHVAAGTDPLVLAESQVTDLTADLASKVDEGDARLTDARTPTTHTQAESTIVDLVSDLAGKAPTVHTHTKSQITDFPVIPDYQALGTAALKDVPASGDATVDQVVKGDDTRLSDARVASDVVAWAKEATKPTYAYSEITTPPTLGTAAPLDVPATGNASTAQVVKGNDTRLADTRTPSAHTHLLAAGATDVTATAAELNVLDGITATVAELNILDTVTATAAELNVLAGITATVTELNYTDGVTSAIQTQLAAKVPLAGGTMTGVLYSQANTSYTTAQVRNVIESTGDASGGGNGDIWIKYLA